MWAQIQETIFLSQNGTKNYEGEINLTQGEKIQVVDGVLKTPNNPVIPFIEGDGTGPDIWRASKRVLDAAVEKAYNGEKKNRLARGSGR